MIEMSMHGCQALRTQHFFPDNANSVGLTNDEGHITFFSLPYEKALALALLFADENTSLYFHGDVTKKLLPNLDALAAMKANDAAKAEAEAEAEA